MINDSKSCPRVGALPTLMVATSICLINILEWRLMKEDWLGFKTPKA
jgi:hypothetical protein